MKHLLKITSAVLVLLLCALGGVFLWRSGFFAALSSQQALQDYISQFAPYSHLCFFLLQFLSVVLAPIPSNLSAAAGGMLFGTWPSFFLTIAAVLSASLLVFLLARALGQSFADRLVSRAISDKYLSIVRAKTDTFLILAFLLPFFPDDLHSGRAHRHLHPPFSGDRCAHSSLGPAGSQRLGRCHPDSPSLGYGPAGDHRCGRLPAGDEIRRPLGGVHPEKIPSYKGR